MVASTLRRKLGGLISVPVKVRVLQGIDQRGRLTKTNQLTGSKNTVWEHFRSVDVPNIKGGNLKKIIFKI